MKKEIILDVHGKQVSVGDKVTLLRKVYGFAGIDRAYLIDAIYQGKGQWGYEFYYKGLRGHHSHIRVREPQVVLYKRKGGK